MNSSWTPASPPLCDQRVGVSDSGWKFPPTLADAVAARRVRPSANASPCYADSRSFRFLDCFRQLGRKSCGFQLTSFPKMKKADPFVEIAEPVQVELTNVRYSR